MLSIIVTAFYVAPFVLDTIKQGRRIGGNRALPILFLGTVFTGWYFSYEVTLQKIRLQILGFFVWSRSMAVDRNANAISETARTLEQVLWWTLNTWGAIFLYAALGGIASVVLIWKLYRNKHEIFEIETVIAFGAGIAFAVVNLFLFNLVNEPVRLSRLMVLMSVLLTGFLLDHIFSHTELGSLRLTRSNVAAVIVVILVLGAIPLTVMNVYSPNGQLTRTEAQGTKWILEHGDFDENDLHTLGQSIKITYYHYDRTVESRYDDISPQDPIIDQGRFPKHLDYPDNETVAKSFDNLPAYLVTKSHDTEYYKIYPETQQRAQFSYYTEEDVNQLHYDPTADKVYANGGYSSLMIRDNSS